jgi:thioredoxin-dependent peroxiredoxin
MPLLEKTMATHLKPGDAAPDFTGTVTDGTSVSLKDFRGKKLVLYFYPMDDTPGCTKEACSLRDANKDIKKKGAAILGVSAQGEASHQKFTDKYKLNFPLLADEKGEVAKAYGAMGGALGFLKAIVGVADRITFIIDEDGKISHVLSDVDSANHAEQVLELL